MRLHPAVTQEEAYAWLKEQVLRDDPSTVGEKDLDTALRQAAEAMAAVSQIVLPDELEPMFP